MISPTTHEKKMFPPTRDTLRDLAACIALFCAVVILYWPALRCDFVSYDDYEYVVDAFQIQSGLSWEGIRWALTTLKSGSWLPLVWFSLMLDRTLFGTAAWGFHLTNILLHAANTVLIFLVFTRMTKRWKPAAIAAILFAAHPLRVESVAWISERKDVLSIFFGMWMLLSYHWYVTRPNAWRYLVVLLFLLLSLASKPMLVTAPCLLLLMDFWPLNRLDWSMNSREQWRKILRLALEKIPFFLMTLVLSVITYIGQKRAGAVSSEESITMMERMINVPISYMRYLARMVWFEKLAVIYPYIHDWPMEQIIGSILLLLVVTVALFFLRVKLPYLLTGWLWYLGLMIPVIGIIQVGSQSIADRYTYLPTIGLFVMIIWLLDDAAQFACSRWCSRRVMNLLIFLGFSAVLAWFSYATQKQISVWKNTDTLFEHAINVIEDNSIAHSNLGMSLVSQGKFQEGMRHMQEAIRINPRYPQARTNLGVIYMSLNRPDLAASEYELVIKNAPNSPQPYNNLAIVLQMRGDLAGAEQHLRKALEIDPEYSDAHNNLGNVLNALGKTEAAVEEFKRALKYHANSPKVLTNLGVALGKLNKDQEALEALDQAIHEDPAMLESRLAAARLLLNRNRPEEALKYLRGCLPYSPGDTRLRLTIGSLLCQLNRPLEALEILREAVSQHPEASLTHGQLGEALLQAGQINEGVAELKKALEIEPAAPRWQKALEHAKTAPQP